MTNEEIAWQLYDELQHNRITNYDQFCDRLYELIKLSHLKNVAGDIVYLMHNKWSFGFCDMCGEYINYDDDPWYDVQMAEPEEREILEKTLPKYQNEVANIIQDVCPTCWHKLLNRED